MFDLNSLALESTAKINLFHPTKEDVQLFENEEKGENPFYIEVHGNHTKEFKEYVRKAAILEQQTNGEKNKKNILTLEDYEIEDEKSIELVASLCVGAYFVFDGKPFEAKHKNFVKLFSDERFVWILEQVKKGIADRANFIKS